MKTKMSFFKTLLLCAITISFSFGTAQAANLGELKQRMKKRVDELDSLKSSGTVGVNNRGYLVIRSDLSEGLEKLVVAENKDRKIVYTYLAKRVNAPVEKVEKKRAAEIAQQSDKGVWLQNSKGKWYQKKAKR